MRSAYKAAAGSQDLVGGQVPMGVLGSTPLIPHHKAGRIKILAFTSKERFPPMPEIPTLHESGLTGFDTAQWLGLLAPRSTPADIVDRLYRETKAALALEDVRARLAQAALQPVGNTPKEFDAVSAPTSALDKARRGAGDQSSKIAACPSLEHSNRSSWPQARRPTSTR